MIKNFTPVLGVKVLDNVLREYLVYQMRNNAARKMLNENKTISPLPDNYCVT
jgi:hypothetical protein